MSIVVGVIVVMTLTAAPAETPLCELGDALLGRWVGEASLLDHAATTDDKQDKVRAELTYRWAIAGHVLEGEWQRGDVSGKWLAVWDPMAQVIKTLGGRSDGNAWGGSVVKTDNGWVEETEGVLGDGAKISSRFVTVLQENNDRVVWEGVFSIDGEQQEPVRDVYEKLACRTSTRDEYREFCKAIQGRWVGDVTWVADWPGFGRRGDKVTAYWDSHATEDGNVLIGKFLGGHGSETSIIYFDASTSQIQWTMVSSRGAVTHSIVYRKDGKWAGRAREPA